MEDRKQQTQFRAIDESENEDFNTVLRVQGFHPDDFEVAEEVKRAEYLANPEVGKQRAADWYKANQRQAPSQNRLR